MQNYTPVEIVRIFDKYIHGQTQAKKMLAIAMRNRYRVGKLGMADRMSVHKQNLLLMGPTGSGKTALMRVLSQKFGLPVLELDMTGFSETGYVGRNVGTIGSDLRELASTIQLPDWYIELRTGKVLEQEVKTRYTREEFEAIRKAEVEEEWTSRAAGSARVAAAKTEHTTRLRSMGILDDEKTSQHYLYIYHLRAFLLGYLRTEKIAIEVELDWRDIPAGIGTTLGAAAKTVVDTLSEIAKVEITSLEQFDGMDFDSLEEEAEAEPQIVATVMGLIGVGEAIQKYINVGLALMSSNFTLACADGGDWYDYAGTFDGVENELPPGLAYLNFDEGEFLIDAAIKMVTDYDSFVDELWDVDEFTKYAKPEYWAFESPKEEIAETSKTTITRKELLTNNQCNGKDFVENFGVVFLDEFDKLAETDDARSHVSRSGVQRSLLKLVEGGMYSGINTSNILFVAGGAFATTKLSQIMPELQGRFPLRAELELLDKDALVQICKLDGSEFHGMIKLLKTEGVETHYDMDTYEYIAERTVEANRVDNLGARRLVDIVHNIFQPAMYDSNQYKASGYHIEGERLRKVSSLHKD